MELQPLRIPAGWHVAWNQLYEVDPGEGYENYFEGSSLLMIDNSRLLRFIDICWRPEYDLNGEFKLVVINYLENYNSESGGYDKDGDWDKPYLEYSTNNRIELVQKLESLLQTLPPFKDPRILKSRGVVDEPSESYRLRLEDEGLSYKLFNEILNHDNGKIQDKIIDHPDVTKEILSLLVEKGRSKGVRKKSKQKLESKRFRGNN